MFNSRNLLTVVGRPAAENLPTPFGDLRAASIDEIADAASRAWAVAPSTGDKNRLAIRLFLGRLQQLPGTTWPQRWEAAGFDECRVMMPEWNPPKSVTATQAVRLLAGLRVVAPSLLALRRNTLVDYAEGFRQAQRDPLLDEFTARVNSSVLGRSHQRRAVNDIAYVLTSQRIGLADLRAEAFMHYITQWRLTAPTPTSEERYTGQLAWEVLHAMGRFGPQVPATLRLAINGLKLDVADMVDNQGQLPADVRQLFIDYVEHRRAEGMDYSSLRGLVRKLIGNFWCEIVQINPAQSDLRVTAEVYAEWRRRLAVLPNGKARITVHDILFAVRALYLDLQSWAVDEPERWARWAAPCPVPDNDRRGYSTGRQRQIDRMADRTRRLQPLVGLLSAHVTERLQYQRELLQRAADTRPDEVFTFLGEQFQRCWNREDEHLLRTAGKTRLRFLAIHSTIDPASGPTQLIFAFEAVVIGGLGSLRGTLVGGLVLGIAQTIGAQIDPQYSILAGHLVFLVVLAGPRGRSFLARRATA